MIVKSCANLDITCSYPHLRQVPFTFKFLSRIYGPVSTRLTSFSPTYITVVCFTSRLLFYATKRQQTVHFLCSNEYSSPLSLIYVLHDVVNLISE